MGKHEPQLYWAGRHGSWCICDCGWASRIFTTVTGAHIEFGHHLLNEERHRRFLALIGRIARERARASPPLPDRPDDDSPIRCVNCGTAPGQTRGPT